MMGSDRAGGVNLWVEEGWNDRFDNDENGVIWKEEIGIEHNSGEAKVMMLNQVRYERECLLHGFSDDEVQYILLEMASFLRVSEKHKVYAKSFHVSEQFSFDSIINSSLEHLPVVCNEFRAGEFGACYEQSIKTGAPLLSSNLSCDVYQDDIMDYFTVSLDVIRYLDAFIIASGKPGSNSSSLDDRSTWDDKSYFLLLDSAKNGLGDPEDPELLFLDTVLFSSSWRDSTFDQGSSVEDYHFSNDLSLSSRILRMSLVESLSDILAFAILRFNSSNVTFFLDFNLSNKLNSSILSEKVSLANPDQFTQANLSIFSFISGGTDNVTDTIFITLFNTCKNVKDESVYKDYGYAATRFELTDFFTVIFKRPTLQKTPQKTPQKATELEKKILDVIRKQPTITMEGIAGELGISSNTVKEYIAKEKGIVETGRRKKAWQLGGKWMRRGWEG